MSPPESESKQPTWLQNLLSGSDLTTRALQGVLAIIGVVSSVRSALEKDELIFWISVAAALIAAGWVAAGGFIRRRKRKRYEHPLEQRSTSSYLRGLLPFEKGEALLGREQEVGHLLAILRSLDFRVGFLSGEAGAGKTSFLRARILTELEKGSQVPVYVSRTGGDPSQSICKQLSQIPGFRISADSRSLLECLREACVAAEGKIVVLIIDQFEEFFVSTQTSGRHTNFAEAMSEVLQADLPLRLLFCLRKEFVDDLLDLSEFLPDLDTLRWRLPLRNLKTETAIQIAKSTAEAERLAFSDELLERVVQDLSRNQLVRPVEFQLVLKSLLSQGVFDIPAYKRIGGAHAVIAGLISDTISPTEAPVSDLENLAGRLALRSLCNNEFTTRRPVGLKLSEISLLVAEQLASKSQSALTTQEIEAAVHRVIRRLLDAYIVIPEEENRINLANDYLTSAIRDATSDLETAEERATKLLETLLSQAQINPATVVSWKTLRYISRFADRERVARSDWQELKRGSYIRQFRAMAIVMTVLFLLALYLLPFGARFPVREEFKFGEELSYLSDDGTVLIVNGKAGNMAIHLDKKRFSPKYLNVVGNIEAVSAHGSFVLIADGSGKVTLVDTRDTVRPITAISDFGWQGPGGGEAGFSKDEQWAFAVSKDGRVFTWPTNSRPRVIMRLPAMYELTGAPIDPNAVRGVADNSLAHPMAGMADDGKWLWIANSGKQLFLMDSLSGRSLLSETINLNNPYPNLGVYKSPDDKWLAYNDGHLVRAIQIQGAKSTPPHSVIDLGAAAAVDRLAGFAFSPNSQWIVARGLFGNLYAGKPADNTDLNNIPAIEASGAGGDDRASRILVAQTNDYAAGRAQNRSLYVWQISNPPRAEAKPVPQSLDASFAFCPNSSKLWFASDDGNVYSVDYKKKSDELRTIGRAAGRVAFVQAKDAAMMFVFDPLRLSVGNCDGSLRSVTESKVNITNVVDDGAGDLVLITYDDLVRVGRSFYVFGLPVWKIGWPQTLRRDQDLDAITATRSQ
jgi:hypothetical protein